MSTTKPNPAGHAANPDAEVNLTEAEGDAWDAMHDDTDVICTCDGCNYYSPTYDVDRECSLRRHIKAIRGAALAPVVAERDVARGGRDLYRESLRLMRQRAVAAEQREADLRASIAALAAEWGEAGFVMEADQIDAALLDNPGTADCNCGFGGFHDDINPRCERNQRADNPGTTLDAVRAEAKAEGAREVADELWRVFLRLPHTPSPLGDYIQRRVVEFRDRADALTDTTGGGSDE